jgi:hypothetical protein
MVLRIRPKNIAGSLTACVAVAFSALTLVPLHAQVAGGTPSGTVTDTSGAVIPETQMSIKNLATERARKDGRGAANPESHIAGWEGGGKSSSGR